MFPQVLIMLTTGGGKFSTRRRGMQGKLRFFFGGGEGWECKLNVSTVADNAYYTSTNCHH